MMCLAERWRIVDKPAWRKIHQHPVPRTGGVAIGIGVLTGLLLLPMNPHLRLGLAGASILLIVTGLYDDWRGLKPHIKLAAQVLAALWAVHWGIRIEWVRTPLHSLQALGPASIPITVFWLVLVTNTINLIDGMDGLAAGITCIVGVTLLISGHLLNQTPVLLFVLCLLGSLLAFLRYNFNPARVFMGDSGSMVCGFFLAAASVLGVFKTTTTFTLAVPVLALGLPLIDTVLAVLRRLRQGRSIFSADNQHLHHRLLQKGYSQRQVVLAAYTVTLGLCLLALTTLTFVKISHF